MELDAIQKLSERIKGFDFSKISVPEPIYPKYELPDFTAIDPENSIMGEISRKIEEQNSLVAQQIGILTEQNGLLAENYSKLKEMYNAQSNAYKEAQDDLKRSRKYNIAMMIITAIAMLAAIAGPIVTILVSK